MLNNIFAISLSMSAVILLLLIISPFLNNRYNAKWRYFVWLAVALRLAIPIRIELPSAPVHIPTPQNQAIVFRQEGIPIQITDNSYIEKGNNSLAPTDYTPIITVQELVSILWAAGAVCFFLYHIISYLAFKGKIKPHCKGATPYIAESVLKKLNIKRNPKFYICSVVASPMMTGFLRPVILLPKMEYTKEELNVILTHELTHYKRGDIWFKLLLIGANAMHWFNPLVYLMVKQANRDLEYSCDDAVVKNSDINFRKQYSLAILKSMQKVEATTLSTYLNGGFGNE